MIQVNEISTKTVKELAQAVTGKWETRVGADVRYCVQGHLAFVECKEHPDKCGLPFTAVRWWKLVEQSGFSLYVSIIQ